MSKVTCWMLGGLILLTISQASVFAAEEREEIGLGVILGEPSGINGQFFWNRHVSIDVTAAWSWENWFFTAADFQISDYILDSPREWKWYYGVGAYLTIPENQDGTLGVRIPLGLRYHFPHSHIDLWGEIAPGLQLIEDTEAVLQGGIGLTFWVK